MRSKKLLFLGQMYAVCKSIQFSQLILCLENVILICAPHSSNRPPGDFEIVIKGRRNNKQGTIAIDNVVITPGACPVFGSNNFESGWNTYTNPKKGDIFDWIIRSGGTPSAGTGPTSDHTLKKTTGKCVGAPSLRATFWQLPPICVHMRDVHACHNDYDSIISHNLYGVFGHNHHD